MSVDLQTHRHVHFVGIGGIGMSALARFLLSRGFTVSGSDRAGGEQVEALLEAGAQVYVGHDAAHSAGADLVVISSAVPPENPEVRAANAAHIPAIKRAVLLGAIANAGRAIAVAGTHGKTTTSALIGHILVEAGLDPTILIGGISGNLGSNARTGGSDLVVVEADEYDASFLTLRPAIAVLTNVEPDHLDFYGTPERVAEAFHRFVSGVGETLAVCADDAGAVAAATGIAAHVIPYGLQAGAWQARELREQDGITEFIAVHGDDSRAVRTRLAGEHNARNILGALAATAALGVSLDTAVAAIGSFAGVQRRLEIKGERGGVLVIDDYAHHPTEIQVNLAAIRARYHRPVRVVFQPHTYSRTAAFLPEFAASFDEADAVYLLDIYAARETDTLGVSGRDLAAAAAERHTGVRYTGTAQETIDAVARDSRAGDIVVTMGAGDVYRLGPAILARVPA